MTDEPAPRLDDADATDAGVPGRAGTPAPPPDTRPRPLIERIGLALIAVVLGALFALVSVASFIGGEPFLGVMGAIGCLMVLWVGGLTLVRG